MKKIENGRSSTRGRRRKIGEVEESTRPKRNVVGGGDEEEKGILKEAPLQDGVGMYGIFWFGSACCRWQGKGREVELRFVSPQSLACLLQRRLASGPLSFEGFPLSTPWDTDMAPAPPSVPSHKRAISVIDLDDSPPPSPSFPRPASTSKPSTAIRGKEWLLAKVDELEGAMRVSRYLYSFRLFVGGSYCSREKDVELTALLLS